MSLLPEKDWCRECNILLPIVNKFYGLCAECNFKRTHGGKTRQEVAVEKHRDKVAQKRSVVSVDQRQVVKRRQKRLKQVSVKQQERNERMHATYRLIDDTREPVCEGCGQGGLVLSHSHLLSQKQRGDLAAEADNIRLHCCGSSYSCHEVWERADPVELVQMLDLRANLRYIEAQDPKKYRRLMIKFEEAGINIFSAS